jgi:ABC-type multidrug transport system ATPase subunit
MELNAAIPCAVSLIDLRHRYGKMCLFQGINAAIQPGEHVVIEGVNGSGKSTLGQIIAGHLTNTDGEIHWSQTKSQQKQSASPLDDIALQTMLMGPASALHPLLNIQELLAFHASLRDWWPGVNPKNWVDDCGLSRHIQSPYSALSSGMQQRVKLILALATQSSLVVLDEPCATLDSKGIDWYREALSFTAQKTTIFVCSNDRKEDYLPPDQVIRLD